MKSLSRKEQESILDYCLGQLSDGEMTAVQNLLDSNPAADQLHQRIKASLQPLNASELLEPCPDDLAEFTVARLIEKARPQADRLHKLIAEEQSRASTVKVPLWHRFTQMTAIAAIVIVGLSIAIPTLRHARERSYQERCAEQLKLISQGLFDYSQDNGRMPSVTLASGSPWWQVGYQGEENYSNTRSVWLLASKGYVTPDKFVCPGRWQAMTPPEIEDYELANLRDFPSKTHMNYSPRVCSDKMPQLVDAQTVLMADTNPLCEDIPTDYSRGFDVHLNGDLLQTNSRNHNGQGQNILTGDGAVTFSTNRTWGANLDDIYSLRSMSQGAKIKGYEMPASENDTFLAP